MNILRSLLLPAALTLAAAFPAGAFAQQAAPPAQNPPAACGEMMHRGGPHMNPMSSLNLTPAQKAQIKQIHEQYRAAHPCGSPPDPAARRAMRQQVLNVLTPALRAQLQSEMQARRGGAAYPASTPQP